MFHVVDTSGDEHLLSEQHVAHCWSDGSGVCIKMVGGEQIYTETFDLPGLAFVFRLVIRPPEVA